MSAARGPGDPLLGRILAERYEILHRLGEGAMGVVYKARHVKVGRPFAVKVLHPRALQDAKLARRFDREAELAGRLHHPNVVAVVDVGEIGDTRYMVMEFAEGPDLAKLLDEAPMPPERIIHLVRQLLEGLYHAHERGLIHRDFKPENVIVERDSHGAEVPRIVDFGIALLRDGEEPAGGKGRLTTKGLVLGTPHYMAPEQAVADPIDHRIDLFALGIVIYEMLSGRLPFDGSGAEVARANLLLDPPAIAVRVPHLEVDPLLEAFARRLMAKERDARPATAKAARALLELIDRDPPAAAKALGVPLDRSLRAPAVTEPVLSQAPGATGAPVQVTARMRPTPRTSEPMAGAAPPTTSEAVAGGAPPDRGAMAAVLAGGAAVHLASASPLDGPAAEAAAVPPGFLYASPVARGAPGPGAGAARRSHNLDHDTAIRTPLGWQTASLPSRRRSRLIGGAMIGAAAGIAAIALWMRSASHDEVAAPEPSLARGPDRGSAAPPKLAPPGAHETASGTAAASAAASDSAAQDAAQPSQVAAVRSAAATEPSDGPAGHEGSETRAPAEPAPPAGAGDATRAAPARRATGAAAGGHRESSAALGRPGAHGDDPRAAATQADRTARASATTVPARGLAAQADAAPGAASGAASQSLAAAGPAGPRESEPAGDAARPHRPARSVPASADSPAPASASVSPSAGDGVSPAALRKLYETAWSELGELPKAEADDLTGQLLVFQINAAMQAPPEARDRAAAQLSQIVQEARRRKAAHKHR